MTCPITCFFHNKAVSVFDSESLALMVESPDVCAEHKAACHERIKLLSFDVETFDQEPENPKVEAPKTTIKYKLNSGGNRNFMEKTEGRTGEEV